MQTDELEIPRWLDTVFGRADYDMSIIAHVEPRDLARFADPTYYFRYNNKRFQHLVAAAAAGTEAQQITSCAPQRSCGPPTPPRTGCSCCQTWWSAQRKSRVWPKTRPRSVST